MYIWHQDANYWSLKLAHVGTQSHRQTFEHLDGHDRSTSSASRTWQQFCFDNFSKSSFPQRLHHQQPVVVDLVLVNKRHARIIIPQELPVVNGVDFLEIIINALLYMCHLFVESKSLKTIEHVMYIGNRIILYGQCSTTELEEAYLRYIFQNQCQVY